MTEERLIISLNEEGNFRVYTPANPTKSYTVSGTPEGPKCTCPDFEGHKNDPEWKCQHMVAVLNLLNKSNEPAASIEKERQPRKEEYVDETISGLRMEIKRSISLDGKINSLSIKAFIRWKAIPRMTLKKIQRDCSVSFRKSLKILKVRTREARRIKPRTRRAATAPFRRRC